MRNFRRPNKKEIREAEVVMRLPAEDQKKHPKTVLADPDRLTHVNAIEKLPEYYIDQVFVCRLCGGKEIWKAIQKKYYYEDLRNHVYAKAVECNRCRFKKRKSRQQT